LHSIYDHPDADAARARFDRVIKALAKKLPTWPSTSNKPMPTAAPRGRKRSLTT